MFSTPNGKAGVEKLEPEFSLTSQQVLGLFSFLMVEKAFIHISQFILFYEMESRIHIYCLCLLPLGALKHSFRVNKYISVGPRGSVG